MSMAMLVALRDPKRALADKLSSLNGANSWALSQEAHAATIGVHGTTDRIESNFGVTDALMHKFRGQLIEHVSGAVLEARAHHLAPKMDLVKHRKSKQQRAPCSTQYTAVHTVG